VFFPVPAGPPGTGLFIFAPPTGQGSRTLVGAVFFTQPIPSLPALPEVLGTNGTQLSNLNNATPRTIGVQPPTGTDPSMNAPMFDPNAQAMRAHLLMQQQQRMQGQPQWMQHLAGQPTQQFGGMNTGMGGMPGARIGAGTMGMIGQTQIPPQAQAQNRLLSGGMNVGNGGMPMPGGGIGLPPGMSGMGGMAGMNFNGGGMPMPNNGMGNMQNMAQGMNMLGMGSLTPEMMRALSGQGNP